jgi:endoglucanase
VDRLENATLQREVIPPSLSRRDFLAIAAVPAPTPVPRWRGFNLQEKFTHRPGEWTAVDPEWDRRNEPFRESDFALVAELGFNFVRLPMSYLCWTNPNDPYRLLEPALRHIDRAVHWGRQYGIHVCINFHRAPGFSINAALAAEPWNLWTDPKAQDIFTHHWRAFAQRYRAVPSSQLSFNLINEPNRCTAAQYDSTIRRAVQAIREVDLDRLVMIDGLFVEAMLPVDSLANLPNAVHSTRGYAPFKLSHYLAPWAGTPRALPEWPFTKDGAVEWDKSVLHRWCIQPWLDFERLGARVFVGEWGCWNRTPHAVALEWMRDFLDLWRQTGWGWALWCFRGSFGILDSGRADVKYETWRGHKLDRKMLELLREG